MAEALLERETEKLVALLGGRQVFRRRLRNPGDLREALRGGFPYAAFDALVEVLGIKPQELADLIGVASRTLSRRKASRHLSPIESDRLYRVAHVVLEASETLGSIDKARVWLHRDNRAVGGRPPIDMLDTEIGVRQVEELLHRIRFGIHS